MISVVCIVITNLYHFPDYGTDNEKGVAVEGRNRIIDDNNFIFHDTVFLTTFYQIIKIQEGKKMLLAVAETDSDSLFFILP